MVIVTGTITLLSRLIGGVASSTLGWATILLFGRVPQSRQRLLDLMALCAVAWVLCLVAIGSPSFAHLVLASVPRPGFVSLSWFGLLVTLGAVGLPAVVGVATAMLAGDRPTAKPVEALVDVLRGYPLTVVLAGTILFLGAWAVARGIRSARRGWTSLHLAMMVKPHGYGRVVSDLATGLAAAGLSLEQEAAPAWFAVPPRVLARVGGASVGGLVPSELVSFRGEELRILVYLSDVALIGKSEHVARARSAIVPVLAMTEAYLTASEESEKIEDRLRRLTERGATGAADFAEIDASLAETTVPYDDWETLYRLRLQVEHETRSRDATAATGRAS